MKLLSKWSRIMYFRYFFHFYHKLYHNLKFFKLNDITFTHPRVLHVEKWLRLLMLIPHRISSLGASIICPGCWKRLTDKNISIPSVLCILDLSVFAASRLLSVVAQLTKMHFVFGDFISRMCYCPLVQINTFHAIYLLTWMVFFVKQIPDMLLYILYFLLLWLLVVSLSSFWFSRRFFLLLLSLAIIFGHLFVSNRDKQQRDVYDEISYNKLNQSSALFSCVKCFLRCQLAVFNFFYQRSRDNKNMDCL